jgi:phosphate:Na+ symporter
MSHMHITNDLEHIGDIIEKDITYIASCKITQRRLFSEAGWEEIKDMHRQLGDLVRMANVSLASNDAELASETIKGYHELARQERRLRAHHFNRLKDGTSLSISTSALHLDLINSFLRISEHIRNICHEIITQSNDSDVSYSHHMDDHAMSCDDFTMAINS